MASGTAFDSLAFIAAALSALTEKHIVTKIEYDRISKEVKRGINRVYECAGEINVVEEIKQTYAKTAQLVAQRHNPDIVYILPLPDVSDEISELDDVVEDEETVTEILIPTETKQTMKWYNGLCCIGNGRNSPRVTQSSLGLQTLGKDQSTPIDKASRKVQRTAKTIDLFVILPLGGTITVEMESSHSLVTNMKQKIKERVGPDVTEQVLHFGGRLLEDGKSLYECKIKANSTIHLSVKGRGGSRKKLFYIDLTYLDPSWDFDFTNVSDGNTQFKRGGYPYYRPCGWNRIAIKVLGKYQNDKWLGKTGDGSNGEWAVTYHGTKYHVFNNISNEGYKIGIREAFGPGVYSAPKIEIAAGYAQRFIYNGVTYKGVFQNRVNPKGVNIKNNGVYWVCPNKNNIRPYGLCVKKCT